MLRAVAAAPYRTAPHRHRTSTASYHITSHHYRDTPSSRQHLGPRLEDRVPACRARDREGKEISGLVPKKNQLMRLTNTLERFPLILRQSKRITIHQPIGPFSRIRPRSQEPTTLSMIFQSQDMIFAMLRPIGPGHITAVAISKSDVNLSDYVSRVSPLLLCQPTPNSPYLLSVHSDKGD